MTPTRVIDYAQRQGDAKAAQAVREACIDLNQKIGAAAHRGITVEYDVIQSEDIGSSVKRPIFFFVMNRKVLL